MSRSFRAAGLTGLLLVSSLLPVPGRGAETRVNDANRLTYLDDCCDPYVFGLDSPKLVTPQWVGDTDVEAVITLGIDDMREPERYEAYLRPILERLKQIDGRAPVSIMTNWIDSQDPQLQKWLQEGLSIETHTADHPCPCLQQSGFETAKSTYDRCVDEMSKVPGSRPVAFRFPCCDSLNTPSPRAFSEIMAKTTLGGNFLQIDTSVCAILNEDDPQLPRSLTRDSQNRPRFAKYAPFRNFVNKVFNYPYPFVVAGSIWEFPIATPDDWQGFHLQQAFNPKTLEDMQAYLDAVVLKQGVANMVFHPYGWIRNDQMAAFVDHAASHKGKVKFLTFKECLERLNKHLLAGQSLRAADGGDNGVRLLDLNNDGYLDVLIGNDQMQRTRLWSPKDKRWIDGSLPVKFVTGNGKARKTNLLRFGVLDASGKPIVLVRNEHMSGAWRFDGLKWIADSSLLRGLELDGRPIQTSHKGRDLGVRLRDIDSDGICELLIANPKMTAAFHWDAKQQTWQRLPFALPKDAWIVNAEGRDGGLRFADVDADGFVDVLRSCERGSGLFLFDTMKTSWARNAFQVAPGQEGSLPMFANNGVNGGGWLADRQVWFQNEETAKLTDGVYHRSFNDLLGNVESRALSPTAALKSFQTPPGYRVELVAAEPLTMDPVAFDWGPDGRLWIAEMADYPLGIDGKGKPGGRVRFLEDTNGDGKYDKSTLFLDGLNFPTGVMAWRDGVLVTAAPEVVLARDTDHDGKCDERTVLFKGFHPGNQQHRVNGLRWNIDGWVYLANGESGGTIRSMKTGAEVDIASRDLRIKPGEGLIETVTGMSQFGRDRDDAGHWFGTNNSFPLYQFVLDDHYLRRNPHVAPPQPTVQVVDRSVPLHPLSRTFARFNDLRHANHFTSACSGTIYRDDLLSDLAGNMIVCEPVHNLVHREVLSREGLLFRAKRAPDEEESHLLRSTDNWFRPVMVRTGPDGAIWIADMYRYVIEHPEWIPDDWEAKLDLRAGHDKGRIYRIVSVDKPLRPVPRLDKLKPEDLVDALDTPNGTQRDRVQQQILSRGEKLPVALLTRLVQHAKHPAARAQALWTLEILAPASVTPELIHQALVDPDPLSRVQGLRLAERRLNENRPLGLTVASLAEDANEDVLLQLAYTLGEWNDDRAAETLGKLAVKHADHAYLAAAVLSSVNAKNLSGVLKEVLAADPPQSQMLEKLLTMAAALGNRAILTEAIESLTKTHETGLADWQMGALASALAQVRRQETPLAESLGADTNKLVQAAIQQARQTVTDASVSTSTRLAAARLLGEDVDVTKALAVLKELIVPRESSEMQTTAIEALSRTGDQRAATMLLDTWDALSPALRTHAFDTLVAREAWAVMLLDRVEQGKITASQIDAARRQQLLQSESSEIQARATKLFSADSGSRQEVVEKYQPVLRLSGNRDRGREVFTKRCAVCHVLEGKGHAVGADLAAAGNKSPTALLVAILDPNRAVEDRYVNYVAVLDDGRQLSGMLASESGESLTLRAQEGKEQVILRKELDVLKNTGKSLMPEGLEKDMTEQELADTIAYVSGFVPPPKQFAGNEPRIIQPDGQGMLELPASACRVYGHTLIFEPGYKNLGMWGSEDDLASWTIELPARGTYRVMLDYACHNDTAGNAFKLEVSGQTLSGMMKATGGWDDYCDAELGKVELSEGTHTLVFRSAGPLPPNRYLLDLRTIRLLPVDK